MPKSVPLPPPGFERLSTPSKIDYVQTLWDVIRLNPDDVPVPDWHKKLLRQRARAHRLGKDPASPWTEVRARIEKQLAARRRRA